MNNRQAAKAVENAIAFEAKKDGLQQRQDGSWTLRLTIAGQDMHQHITTAAMGTRYQVVVVEINDDETPVDHKAEDRDKWRELGPARQAGIRCKDPVFWAYLAEELYFPIEDEKGAAEAVRQICHVTSRSDFGRLGYADATLAWHELDNDFQAWKVAENG